MNLTKADLDNIHAVVISELHGFVDANTKPQSRAAAAFTKRQAEDLKAGMSDGASSIVRALLAKFDK